MQFRVLGVPEIHDDVHGRTIRLRSAKQRLLLGALVAVPGRPVSCADLIRELWGEVPPAKAPNALQAHVSRLRRLLISLEPEHANSPRLARHGDGYLLRVHPDETDIGRFERLLEQGHRQVGHDAQAAWALLRQALGLWRGAALDGSLSGPVCAGAAIRLERERVRALMTLVDCARPPAPAVRGPGRDPRALRALVGRLVSHQQALHETLLTLAEVVDPQGPAAGGRGPQRAEAAKSRPGPAVNSGATRSANSRIASDACR